MPNHSKKNNVNQSTKWVKKKIQKNQQQTKKKTSNYKGVVAAGGSTVKRAFGARGMGAGKASSKGLLMCWNALNERHLALPRSVGQYQVLRFTRIFQSSSNLVIIGAFGEQVSQKKRPEHATTYGSNAGTGYVVNKDGTESCWSSICAIASTPEDVLQPLAGKKGWSGATNDGTTWDSDRPCAWKMYEMKGLSQMRDGSQVCPSAITVQIMNASAMQTAHGQILAGVMNTQLARSHYGGHQTPEDIGNNFVAYQKPRLLVGARLALRQAQASSYPLDMSEVSDFRNISDQNVAGKYHGQNVAGVTGASATNRYWGAPHTVDSAGDPNAVTNLVSDTNYGIFRRITNIDPQGWAPICIYRPPTPEQTNVVNGTIAGTNSAYSNGAFPEPLTYAVTIEYRARFPVEDPAVASHKMWPMATDKQWHQAISAATALLPGVQDGFTTESKGVM